MQLLVDYCFLESILENALGMWLGWLGEEMSGWEQTCTLGSRRFAGPLEPVCAAVKH